MGHTDLRLVHLTQELAKVENVNGGPIDYSLFPVGSLVRIFPNHSCLTAALYLFCFFSYIHFFIIQTTKTHI